MLHPCVRALIKHIDELNTFKIYLLFLPELKATTNMVCVFGFSVPLTSMPALSCGHRASPGL